MGIILLLTSYNTRYSIIMVFSTCALRPHVYLWVTYMITYTFLLALIPCTWISYIWDQIIDPEFDLEHIEQPQNRLINAFYQVT